MKRVMSLVIVCGVLVVGSLSVRTRGQQELSPPAVESPQPVVIASTLPPPQTRVEAVMARKNALLLRGSSEPAVLNGDDGSQLRLSAVIVKDLRAGLTESGLLFELRGAGRDEQEAAGYVDRDELNAVIEALGSLGNLDPADTAGMPHFDALFRTRGEIEIGNLEVHGSRLLSIRAMQIIAPTGQINTANALFRMSRLEELHRMVSSARETLERE